MKFEKYPLICIKCNKQFLGDKPTRKYCSSECAGNNSQKIIKHCLYCNTEYAIPKHRNNTAGWCSRVCYDAYRQIIKEAQPAYKTAIKRLMPLNLPRPENYVPKEREHKKLGTPTPCTVCGESMPYSPRRLYCDKCKVIMIKEQDRIRRRKRGILPKTPASELDKINNNVPCTICGWNEASCDKHHIVPKKSGGDDVEENIIILCPNHHRLADRGTISILELYSYKRASVI